MGRMHHRFQCRCGTVQGEIAHAQRGVRGTCYCGDCQAYAHLIGQAPQVLDPLGGTDIVAVQARNVRLASGTQGLGCLSLSPRGLLRWYARCCNTPLANTTRDWKLAYMGMVHTCLREPQPLEASFPEVQMRVHTRSAKDAPPPAAAIAGKARLARLMLGLTASRLSGGYRSTPLFDAYGHPVVPVEVAPEQAVRSARQAAGLA